MATNGLETSHWRQVNDIPIIANHIQLRVIIQEINIELNKRELIQCLK